MTVSDLARREWMFLIDLAMEGIASPERLGFRHRAGNVRSFALEVNVGESDDPLERLERIAGDMAMAMRPTADPALAIVNGDRGGFFVDLVDPRFWLVHTTGASGWLAPELSRLVGRSVDVDWCWLPVEQLEELQVEGRTRWFKSDFRGDELLPKDGVKARRLKVQLEGDDADELRRHIASLQGYEAAASLTGVTVELDDADLGRLTAAVHYRGGFTGHGASFALHQAFVGRAVGRYADRVRRIEEDHHFRWAEDGRAAKFTGRSVVIRLNRLITDLERFAAGIFASKEPFRLWALTSAESQRSIDAEVVDLHVGQRFRMHIAPDSLRLYLDAGTCANSVFRLLTNLQHRYDATASIATAE